MADEGATLSEAGDLRAQVAYLQASLVTLGGALEDAILTGDAHVAQGGIGLENWKAKVALWREALEDFSESSARPGTGDPESVGRLASRMASEFRKQQDLIEDLRQRLQEVRDKLEGGAPDLDRALGELVRDPVVLRRLEGVVTSIRGPHGGVPASQTPSQPSWRHRLLGFLGSGGGGRNGAPLDWPPGGEGATREQVVRLEAWGRSLGRAWFQEIDRLGKRQPGFSALIRKSLVAPDVFGHGVEGQDFRRLTTGEAARLLEIVEYDTRPDEP